MGAGKSPAHFRRLPHTRGGAPPAVFLPSEAGPSMPRPNLPLNSAWRVQLFAFRPSLYIPSVKVAAAGVPFALGGGVVGSPKDVLTSSSDLPCAAIVLILAYL